MRTGFGCLLRKLKPIPGLSLRSELISIGFQVMMNPCINWKRRYHRIFTPFNKISGIITWIGLFALVFNSVWIRSNRKRMVAPHQLRLELLKWRPNTSGTLLKKHLTDASLCSFNKSFECLAIAWGMVHPLMSDPWTVYLSSCWDASHECALNSQSNISNINSWV